MDLLLAILLAAIALLGTTAFHYEVISVVDGRLRLTRRSIRLALPGVIVTVVLAHLIEIAFYAMIFAAAAGPLALGGFVSAQPMSADDYFYFTAQTYSTLGYGDVVPTGRVRILAGIAPLNGLLLLAWSGSFLYNAVHRRPVAAD
jgi:hypothetical protein